MALSPGLLHVYDESMTWRDIKERIARLDPLVVDTMVAVGLTLLVCLMVYVVSATRSPGLPQVPNWRAMHPAGRQASAGIGVYALIALTFMPLAVRRKIPWLALVVSGTAALVYALRPGIPPAPTILAPMIALYTLASGARQRRVGLLALVVIGVMVAVPVFAFSSSVRWVAEAVGSFVMLAAAALLGEAERNRREYIAEVERRAAEAERTREEEALRRVDEERIRIAREVHDIVAHSLSIVTVQAGAAATLLETDPASARDSVENIRATSKNALAELRSMLDVLRTGEGEAPLAPTADVTRVDALAEPLRDAGIAVDVTLEGDVTTLPAYASVSAYRIVQEALTNVLRHAEAHSVRVSVTARPDLLTLSIADDGAGAGSDAAEPRAGHGLRGMRERVEALGGSLSAEPGEAGGFTVTASIPLTRSAT